MRPKIITIGVYGFDKDRFFQALIDAKIDTFCDIRLRRGMRGSLYAFVNSASLQRHLRDLGIRYIHIKELAPSKEIREKQKHEDEMLGVGKRTRTALGDAFIQAYEQECLSHFDSGQFLKNVGEDAQVIGLFCVERDPDACHRSLAAKHLACDLGLHVEHIRP
jgi:uncharacterized protein (DUF488 family)